MAVCARPRERLAAAIVSGSIDMDGDQGFVVDECDA